ncbi:MAG: glycosyltransferase family 1 protein [Clostridia bacterium]|nr:MAG: glycosyltransferase family 1 protein [Clostridia bacterium]
MRLLAIAPTAFYNDYGCHVRIRGQLDSLQARGYAVHLVTYPVGDDVPGFPVTRPLLPGLRQMPVGSSRRKTLLDMLLGPTALAAAIRFRPRIIHAYLHEGVLIGWMLSRLLDKPLTFDYQGSLTAEMITHRFLDANARLHNPLARLERWLNHQPQAIFTSTQHAQNALQQQGIASETLHFLPDAVDPAIFHPQTPDPGLQQQLGLHPDTPTCVYLGLLAPYQGIDLLLNAIARLPENLALQCLVMGFPHVARYQKMAESLNIAQKVHFTGPIPYQQAPRYLALGNLAVAPKLATSEGSGKLLPYMSMALPIVATDTPAHRQYLDELALYTPPRVDALARTLTVAFRDLKNLKAMGEKLRARVQKSYTWQHTASKMTGIFEDML